MRADRLISILLLLQQHKRLSAADMARRLEVSTRTIFRDIDALGMAGIPLYAEHGTDGGYSLLETYKVDLTGLNADELLSLFLQGNGPAAHRLGLERETGSALRKLLAALPETQRQRIRWYTQRILMDPEPEDAGGPSADTTAQLAAVQQAVFQSLRLEIHLSWPREGQSGDYLWNPARNGTS